MNIVIGKLHESGNEKYHNNEKIGSIHSPILFINKKLEIKEQIHWDSNDRGESSECLGCFLCGEEQ